MKSILVFLILLVPSITMAATEVAREASFRPVYLTYEQLAVITDNLKGIVEKANAGTEEIREGDVSLTISAAEDTVTVRGWERITDIKGLPNPGMSIRFRYSKAYAPIASIEINLNDSYRQLVVSGTDQSQVSSAYAYLKDEISRNQVLIGGNRMRALGSGALWAVAGGLLLISVGAHQQSKVYKNLAYLLGVAIVVSIFALPWAELMPGTAVYLESASFLDRNINVISLVGVIATFAIPLFGLIASKKHEIEPPKEET